MIELDLCTLYSKRIQPGNHLYTSYVAYEWRKPYVRGCISPAKMLYRVKSVTRVQLQPRLPATRVSLMPTDNNLLGTMGAP